MRFFLWGSKNNLIDVLFVERKNLIKIGLINRMFMKIIVRKLVWSKIVMLNDCSFVIVCD